MLFAKHKAALAALLMWLLMATPVMADLAVDPGTIATGAPITSSQLNNRFSPLYTTVNGLLANDNIKASAGIVLSKLAQTSNLFILMSTGNNTVSSGITGDTIPRVTLRSEGGIQFGAGGASALDLLLKRSSSTKFALRNAADSAFVDLDMGVLTLGTPLAIGSGGTGNASLGVSALGIYNGDGSKVVQTTGTAGQSWRVNAGGTAVEAYTPPTGKLTLSSKSADFTANGASGTFYQMTAASAIAVTLPASPADGTIYYFKIVSGTGLVTFTANGVETIDLHVSSGTTATMRYSTNGVMGLCAVTGGWQVI